MRTTIKIDDHLLADAKAQAARSGRTLNEVVEDALRESLGRVQRSTREGPIELPTYVGGRLQPGVDLDDGSALMELMELMEGTDA
jgi:Arc/MetJ family transcription regulator